MDILDFKIGDRAKVELSTEFEEYPEGKVWISK